MRRIYTVIISGTLSFVFVLSLLSAPAYGPRMPQRGKFFCGFQNYTLLRRNLEGRNGRMRSVQDFFLLSYGVNDWLSIDLKGGAGLIKQHPCDATEIDYPTYMGGGYGFRIKLMENSRYATKVIFGFQHISIHPKHIQINGVKYKAVLDDWQFSLLLSKDTGKFTPYLGTKWSRADYINWQDNHRNRIKSDLTHSVGLIVGIDLPARDNTWINLEGHFVDETAFSFAVMFRI